MRGNLLDDEKEQVRKMTKGRWKDVYRLYMKEAVFW